MTTSLLQNCRWLISGDFNFVEFWHDKTSSCNRLVPLQVKLVFNALKLFLNVSEPQCSADSQCYSSDNFRRDGQRVLVLLNRCYLFPSSAIASRKVISYRIKGNLGWSDCLLPEYIIQLKEGHPGLSHWHMSVFLSR